MPRAKKVIKLECEDYFIATDDQQPELHQSLRGQLNELLHRYTSEGWEPLAVQIQSQPSTLTLPGGSVGGVKMIVLWALKA